MERPPQIAALAGRDHRLVHEHPRPLLALSLYGWGAKSTKGVETGAERWVDAPDFLMRTTGMVAWVQKLFLQKLNQRLYAPLLPIARSDLYGEGGEGPRQR
jgi:hypothetical protein